MLSDANIEGTTGSQPWLRLRRDLEEALMVMAAQADVAEDE